MIWCVLECGTMVVIRLLYHLILEVLYGGMSNGYCTVECLMEVI